MFYVATDAVHDSIPVLHCRYSMWRTPSKPTAIPMDPAPFGSLPSCGIPAAPWSSKVGIRCGGSRRALRVTYGRGSCPRSLSLRGQACHSEGDRDAALAMRQQGEQVCDVRRRCGSTHMSSRSIHTNVSVCCTHSRQDCFTYACFTSNRCILYTNKLVRIVSTIYCPRFCDVAG